MANTLYECNNFFNKSLIETDKDLLIITKEDMGGKKKFELKFDEIEKISVKKNLFSYSLSIERQGKEPLTVGGFKGEILEELKKELGSLVEIHLSRKQNLITIEDGKRETAKILKTLGDDFDPRPFVSFLILQSINLNSSDIHFTPGRKLVSLHYRIDGLLHEICFIEIEKYEKIIASIKNLAKLPSYKKSVPQDGSFTYGEGKKLDIRCATIPTIFGEKLVLRILDTEKTPLFLEELGFSEKTLKDYKKIISNPQGCIILTGPAGSGKSTTIFASLIYLYNKYKNSINIATVEDPVEYIIEEFQQTQVNPVSGLTFASGLKSLLRLDPDILMVGEIRDPETAQMAIRASLTGHLLFTTIHARNSLGVFPRLVEMDIKAGLVSSAVTAVLYERLVRKLCDDCKTQTDPPEEVVAEFKKYNIKINDYYTAKGCEKCSYSGYYGRTGIFELLILDEELRELIGGDCSYSNMFDYCKNKNMNFLWENGLEKINLGITDYSELTRTCPVT